MTQLLCVGLSYQTTPLDIRELATISTAQQTEMLLHVANGNLPAVEELVIVSTCNRTELYAVGESEQAIPALIRLWAEHCDLPESAILAARFELVGDACIEHLFRVAAGLDSQLIGEPQILGQVTDAYERAHQQHATGATLSALMQAAIQAGKRVRHETALGHGALSISSVAATHSQEVLGSLDRATVLIIGAGEMARTAAAAFVRSGIDQLYIANHNHDHAQEIADQWNGRVVSFTQLSEALIEADLVITAIAAPHTLLHMDDIKGILGNRQGRTLIIFDLGLPRNVDPEISELADVKLFNLDDLQAVTDGHYAVRQSAIPDAEAIVAVGMKEFKRWQASRGVVPVIRHLREKAEAIRQSELEHLVHRWPELSEHEQRLLEDFSHRLVNKLLHDPTLTLKAKSAEGVGDLYTDVVDALFNLRVSAEK